MKSFRFPKKEHLCSEKDISEVFLSGKARYVFPLKMAFLEKGKPSDIPVLAAFTVAKRTFKRAVDRNLLKRRMREAYRLNRGFIIEKWRERDSSINLVFIYNSGEILDYASIEKAMKTLLGSLLK